MAPCLDMMLFIQKSRFLLVILIKLAKTVKDKSLVSICSHVPLKVEKIRTHRMITTKILTVTMNIPAVHRSTTNQK